MLITALNPCGLPYGVSLNSGFPSGTRIPREGKVLPEGTMASMLTPSLSSGSPTVLSNPEKMGAMVRSQTNLMGSGPRAWVVSL